MVKIKISPVKIFALFVCVKLRETNGEKSVGFSFNFLVPERKSRTHSLSE